MYLIFILPLLASVSATTTTDVNDKTDHVNLDGSRESWGYVKVRPGANIFWWLYYTTAPTDYYERPLVLWLNGGPRSTSTGSGNFMQIGTLDLNLYKRNNSWIEHVNLLFVDSPVGTGFSYVKSQCLLNKNNEESVYDLLQLFSTFLESHPEFQTSPFYIFSEAFGGKIGTEFALELHKRIRSGEIACDFKGISLGGPLISAVDSTLSWGPYLYSLGMIDKYQEAKINHYANVGRKALGLGLSSEATTIRNRTFGLLRSETDGMDLHNVLYPVLPPKIVDLGEYREQVTIGELMAKITNYSEFPTAPKLEAALIKIAEVLNQRYLTFSNEDGFLNANNRALRNLMNGKTIRNKLGIIPKSVIWGAQSPHAFQALGEDFMNPVVNVVEELLNYTPIQVMISSGQLNLLFSTTGTLQWVNKMEWEGLQEWRKAPRNSILINGATEMYEKSYGNFSFYWILKAGHFVPLDAPETAVEMLKCMTKLKNCGYFKY